MSIDRQDIIIIVRIVTAAVAVVTLLCVGSHQTVRATVGVDALMAALLYAVLLSCIGVPELIGKHWERSRFEARWQLRGVEQDVAPLPLFVEPEPQQSQTVDEEPPRVVAGRHAAYEAGTQRSEERKARLAQLHWTPLVAPDAPEPPPLAKTRVDLGELPGWDALFDGWTSAYAVRDEAALTDADRERIAAPWRAEAARMSP